MWENVYYIYIMARPKKDPDLLKNADLRIPVTAAQKISITAASTGAGQDFAHWAREVLLAAAAEAEAKQKASRRRKK